MKHFSIIQVLQENDIQSSVSMMSPGEHVVPFRACLGGMDKPLSLF